MAMVLVVLLYCRRQTLQKHVLLCHLPESECAAAPRWRRKRLMLGIANTCQHVEIHAVLRQGDLTQVTEMTSSTVRRIAKTL